MILTTNPPDTAIELIAIRKDEYEAMREKLKRVAHYMSGQVHNRGEYVRQTNGTIKWELVPTVAGELYKELIPYRGY